MYAHLEQTNDEKFVKASYIVENPAGLVVSVQVLNEYYSVMLKNGADDSLIQAKKNWDGFIYRLLAENISVPVFMSNDSLHNYT